LCPRSDKEPYGCCRKQIERHRERHEQGEEDQPIERERLVEIERLKSVDCKCKQIAEAEGIDQYEQRVDMLPNRPEDCDENRSEYEVDVLLTPKLG
jgi:3-methyladenine DNA glycosylase/8-oxoguanine DNA glycosylase